MSALVVLSACSRTEHPDARVSPSVLSDTIALTSVPLLGVDSLLPETNGLVVAIDTTGAVAWVDYRRDSPLGIVIPAPADSTPIVRFGVRGEGPGELRMPWLLHLDVDGVVAFEPSGERMTRFDRAGAVVRDWRSGFIVGLSAHRAIREVFGESGWLVVDAVTGRSARRLEPPSTDSVWQRLQQRTLSPGFAERYAMALTGDTLWLAMIVGGDLYRLVQGEPLQPFGEPAPLRYLTEAEVRAYRAKAGRPIIGPKGEVVVPEVPRLDMETFRRKPQRITPPLVGLQVDGAGRLWRFREAPGGARADVFRDTVRVAEVPLPCAPLEKGVRVSGRWLILACAADGSVDDREVVLHRFRF